MKEIIEHIRCGRFSGIRWCCILWYITIWTRFNRAWSHEFSEGWRMKRNQALMKKHIGYQACPVCLFFSRPKRELRRCRRERFSGCVCPQIRNTYT